MLIGLAIAGALTGAAVLAILFTWMMLLQDMAAADRNEEE
jgi:hypothetical protein